MTTITEITSITIDSPGAGQVTIVATYDDVDFSVRPARQVTVTEYPENNPNFSRGHRISDEAYFVLRAGANTFAMQLLAFSTLAYTFEPTLTFAPFITSPPTANASVAKATKTLTSDNTNVADGEEVVIGSKTYTFKDSLTPTEGEVLIGANVDASLLNLIRAINHTGTPDTDYKCAAANTQVTAASAVTAHAFAITAITEGVSGNSIATTTTSAHLSWGGSVMSGGGVASFTVVAASELAATYQWQESADGDSWSNLSNGGIYSNVTTATMTLTPTDTSKNNYYYRCVVSNSQGDSESDAAKFTVT